VHQIHAHVHVHVHVDLHMCIVAHAHVTGAWLLDSILCAAGLR